MKKLLTIVILAIVVSITSCQQQPGPQPNQPTTPAAPTLPDLTTDAGIAATLIGTWTYDSSAVYMNGVWTQHSPMTPGAQITFTNNPYDNTPGSDKKECHTQNSSNYWRMSATIFQQSGSHFIDGGTTVMSAYIQKITTNTIVTGASSAIVMQGTYSFCHKNP